MSMITDVKQYLTDEGITETIYLGYMPVAGGTALLQVEGETPLISAELERPGLQVQAQNADYETAMASVESIGEVLNQLGNEHKDMGDAVTINGTMYLRILPKGSAESLGKNDNGQFEIVQNFIVTKEMK